jgi:hypothetical protein
MGDDTVRYVGGWIGRQPRLFPHVAEEIDPLTAKLEQLIIILDTLGLEAYVASPSRGPGRPAEDRPAIARAFVGKPARLKNGGGAQHPDHRRADRASAD